MLEKPIVKREFVIGGRPMILETGRLARQAGGAVCVRYGDTTVLSTATMAKNIRAGIDFLPLTVDYEERFYAVGKIPGGFIKREGRPSEKAVLSGRLIDRPIRPLFPKELRNDVQVISTVMSVDQDHAPEITAMIGASAALHISRIPLKQPIAGVIVGRVDGEFVINPVLSQSQQSDLHLLVVGTRDAVMMVEAGAKEVPENIMLEAIAYGHSIVAEIVEFIEKFREEALQMGLAKEKMVMEITQPEESMMKAVTSASTEKLDQAIHRCISEKLSKQDRDTILDEIKTELLQRFLEDYPGEDSAINKIIDAVEKKTIRKH